MERYSGRKRRAAADDDDYEQRGEEEDESEEQKVEKFFALISSTREARDRLRGETHDRNNKLKEEDEEVKKQQQQQQAAWNPTFLPQDFVHTMDEKNRHKYNMISIPPLPVPSQKFISEEQDEKGKDDGGLNLRLSLSL